jgi:hypothetical protein
MSSLNAQHRDTLEITSAVMFCGYFLATAALIVDYLRIF